MFHLDLAAIAATPVNEDPFRHMLVTSAVRRESVSELLASCPAINKPGSFEVTDLQTGLALRELIDELRGDAFRRLMSEKFDVDLTDRPTCFTLRGACALKDGQIHTDSNSKILSILLYLNPGWTADGGRLRLLRSGRDLEDFAVEIEPTFGRMLVFRRSEHSWHGHYAFAGPRRVLQMNYLRSSKDRLVSAVRHHLSALVK